MRLEAIVTNAIELEKRDFELYSALAARVRNEPARAMLLRLAADEGEHRQTLERVLATGDLAGLPDPSRTSPPDGNPRPIPGREAGPEEFIRFAIENERRSMAAYREMASEYAGTPFETLCLRLAAEESRHMQELQSEYDRGVAFEN